MCCSLQHYFLSLVLKNNWQNFLKIALSGHYIFRKKMGQHRPCSKSSWILIPEITKRDHWLKNFLFYQNITVSYDWYFVFFSKKCHFQLETMSLITMGNNKGSTTIKLCQKIFKAAFKDKLAGKSINKFRANLHASRCLHILYCSSSTLVCMCIYFAVKKH